MGVVFRLGSTDQYKIISTGEKVHRSSTVNLGEDAILKVKIPCNICNILASDISACFTYTVLHISKTLPELKVV